VLPASSRYCHLQYAINGKNVKINLQQTPMPKSVTADYSLLHHGSNTKIQNKLPTIPAMQIVIFAIRWWGWNMSVFVKIVHFVTTF